MIILKLGEIEKKIFNAKKPKKDLWIYANGVCSMESEDTIPHPDGEKPIIVIKS